MSRRSWAEFLQGDCHSVARAASCRSAADL